MERKSKTLKGYVTFIAKVREYIKKNQPLEEAIKLAVNYCIKKGMLIDFFEKKAQEVIKMIKLEYTLKDAIKFAREEGKKEGIEKGLEKGIEKGLEKGKKKA